MFRDGMVCNALKSHKQISFDEHFASSISNLPQNNKFKTKNQSK